jgi:hypothetical protein
MAETPGEAFRLRRRGLYFSFYAIEHRSASFLPPYIPIAKARGFTAF